MPPQKPRFCQDQSLSQSSSSHLAATVQEYATLSRQAAPSQTAVSRIDEILRRAETDAVLNQHLIAVDQAICCRQNLLTYQQQEHYRNTLARMSEFVDLDSFRRHQDIEAWKAELRCLRHRIDLLQP